MQSVKKATIPVKKLLWPIFFHVIGYDKPYDTSFFNIHALSLAPKNLSPTRA